MISRGLAQLRSLSSGEALAAVGGLSVFGHLGWDPPLWDANAQAALHLVALGAISIAIFFVVRGAHVPRTRLEVPLLVLVAVLGLAAIVGQNTGLAVGAVAASIGFAAMLPLSLAVLARRPGLVAGVVVIPTLLFALATVVQMAARRFGWYLAGGPGLLPPVRVDSESTVFGSVAVPVFVLLGLLPLTLAVGNPLARRSLQSITVALGVVLATISGSRSGWIAVVVAGIVFAAPELRRLHLLRLTRRRARDIVALSAGGLVLLAVVAYEAPRLTGLSSLLYRGRLWGDTLAAWSVNPLLGVGPGTMPYARQAVARFPLHQLHSHDIALGVLGDAGIAGLVAAAALVVAFFWLAGPHRARTLRGRAAGAVLAGYLVAGLFEDITFLPGFSLLIVLLAALALTDAEAVSWRPARLPRPLLVGGLLAAAALLTVIVLRDTAAVAYRAGSTAASVADWGASTRSYQLAETLDPWHPATPKALAIAADAAGDQPTAMRAARRATELNPGDGWSWLNLALLCDRLGDSSCAHTAGEASAGTIEPGGAQLANTAILYERFGLTIGADELYALALRQSANVALTLGWPRPLPVGAIPDAASGSPGVQLNIVLARTAGGLPSDPEGFTAPAVRAFAWAIAGNRSAAAAELARAQRSAPGDVITWEMSALLARHWGQDPSRAIAISDVLRGGPAPIPSLPSLTWDVTSLRTYPLDQLLIGANHLIPREAWPWPLEQFLR
jgi:tetratricopeptide (TPR) repeat protein